MNPLMPEFTQHPQTLVEGLVLLFALLIGHFLGDYPLQGEFLALHKDRHYRRPGEGYLLPRKVWIHCLIAHSFIHAGFVWLITGRFVFALAEVVLHACIDAMKCEKITSYHTDQLLHLLCKATYVTALVMGWLS